MKPYSILETRIGERLARKVFEARGNHSEIHLSEKELAELCMGAARLSRIGCTEPIGEVAAADRAMMERKPLMSKAEREMYFCEGWVLMRSPWRKFDREQRAAAAMIGPAYLLMLAALISGIVKFLWR